MVVGSILKPRYLIQNINLTEIIFQLALSEPTTNESMSNDGRRRSIQSISQLGNALSNEHVDPSTKLKIVWPKEKCKMLGEEVVIIDSPGIDVETDLDAWIDRVCLDR